MFNKRKKEFYKLVVKVQELEEKVNDIYDILTEGKIKKKDE